MPPRPLEPRGFGARLAPFDQVWPSPPVGMLWVPDGLIRGPHGWVFTSDGQFLADCAWPNQESQHPRNLPRSFGKGRRLRGTCLNLATDWGGNNYGHFLFESLGRYGIFERSGIDAKAIDHIYCPAPDSDLTKDLIQRLGIPLEKCVWTEEEPQVSADMVLATTFPGSRYNYPPWLLTFLKQGRGGDGQGARRIYVPRGNVRNVSNLDEVLEVLRSFEFEIYDFTRQGGHHAFAEAEVVVGPLGAGLSNFVFCKPGAQVLEILPSDSPFPFFHIKVEGAGMHHSYLVGESLGARPPGSHGPSPYDFRVDPEELRFALQQLTSIPPVSAT
jgi:hypothetical protein